ncbi:AbiH family protein [Enterococcus gilvus]|uniref:Bacteriophage abortive infection AbiH n=1 Tax=Enterococcus gilvus ATCC BAA-350 TaxID=1158614 RepID=R2XA55_9ENTE|nr:AbiH family protein [Enterococcus gilvus]EOI51468.1 hypothetical protein UKC_04143 [Enterococcus gilvus ATCC BAA-350]EOW77221.1 hypothetical protein I592_04197 [Enterococcus gilvus ATCC BAA-350]OJG41122.1 hypothetical protein RV02_GL001209 [Enterococcus gilvus]
MKNLLVLGNGFDLTCNLRSKYEQYFHSKFSDDLTLDLDRLKKEFEEFFVLFCERSGENRGERYSLYSEAKDYFNDYKKPKKINIWDLIIYYGKEGIPDKWNDVESRILDFLVYEPYNSESKRRIPNFIQIKESKYTIDKIRDEENKYSSYFYSQLIIFVASLFNLPDPSTSKSTLLSELKKFENNFREYLLHSLDDPHDMYCYKENAEHLLENIKKQANPEFPVRLSVLSFNYTRPFTSNVLNVKHLQWQNIHGRLEENNIILGIDQNKVNVKDVAYRFTKTYRQLLQNDSWFNQTQTILPNKEDIHKIIFYGHSLSEADYSYFQSIFDYYDIYLSRVELIFFYNDYRPNIQQEQVLDVSRLIKKYGQTMVNKDHGDNLLHKLIIEKRLSVRKLLVSPML